MDPSKEQESDAKLVEELLIKHNWARALAGLKKDFELEALSSREERESSSALLKLSTPVIKNEDASKFVCNLCKQSFARKFTLERHMQRRHSQHHPVHKCTQCGKEYKNVQDLKTHIKREHEDLVAGNSAKQIKYDKTLANSFKVKHDDHEDYFVNGLLINDCTGEDHGTLTLDDLVGLGIDETLHGLNLASHEEHLDIILPSGRQFCLKPNQEEIEGFVKHAHGEECGCKNVVKHDDHWDFLIDQVLDVDNMTLQICSKKI